MQGQNQFRLRGKTSLSAICSILSIICVITLLPVTAFSELQPVTTDDTFELGRSVSMAKIDGINVAVAGAGDSGDGGKVYILTRGVDGWSSSGSLMSPDKAKGDQFGKSVALTSLPSGSSFLLVGAPSAKINSQEIGTAYIFKKGAGNSWAPISKLTPEDKIAYMEFGSSVAIDEDYAIVGSPRDNNDSNKTSGAVYIYRYNGTGWGLDKRLARPVPGINDPVTDNGIRFGESVAISGNYVAVGASGYPNESYEYGVVYIYELVDGQWTQKAKIIGPEETSGVKPFGRFGKSVALAGDYLVVGAEKESSWKGAAYIYKRDASGTWNLYSFPDPSSATQSKLTADIVQAGDAAEGDLFGSSVSVSSEASSLKVLVGAMGKNGYKGAAYYFDINATGSVFTKLLDSAAVANEQFGISGAIADEYFMVGANGYKIDNAAVGAVFVDLSDDSVNLPPVIEFTDANIDEEGRYYTNDPSSPFGVEFSIMDDISNTLKITAIEVENITEGVTVVSPSNVSIAGSLPTVNISVTPGSPETSYVYVTPNNEYGEALITVTMEDPAGVTAKASFSVFFKHDPTISSISDQTMTEDTPLDITFTVADEDIDDLTLDVSSSNLQLFNNAGMVLDKTALTLTDTNDQTVTLTLTPVANANSEEPVSAPLGEVDITVTVSDVGGSSEQTFRVYVTPDNDPPNDFEIKDQTTAEDVELTVTFTVSDNETSAGALIVTASSADPLLVPDDDEHLVLSGTGETRTLKIIPAWDANSGEELLNTATITVTVSDGEKETPISFELTITPDEPADDVPLICFVEETPTVQCAEIPDQTIDEDGTVELRFKVHNGDKNPVTVTITSGDESVLPSEDTYIDMNGNGMTYEPNLVNGEAEILLRLTPPENRSGTSNININVQETGDASQQSDESFWLTVVDKNDKPVVSIDGAVISEQYKATTDEDTPIGIDLVLTDVDNLSSELKISDVTTQSSALVAQTGIAYTTTGGSNQTITITPFNDANSGDTLLNKATITVTVTDGTDTVSFNIILTITPVNDAPDISGTPDATVNQGVYYEFVPTVSDIENDNISFAITNKPSWATFDPVSGKLSGTPGNDDVGDYTGIKITVTDDGDPNKSASLPLFSIGVIDVNDPPTITTIFNTPSETTQEDTDWSKSFEFSDIDPDEKLTVSISVVSPSPADLIKSVFVDDIENAKEYTMAAGSTTGAVTLKIVPTANKYGTAAITVSVDDGEAPAVEKTFAFKVTSVNDLPEVIIPIPEINMLEDATDSGAEEILISVKDLDVEPLTVSLAIVEESSNRDDNKLIKGYDFIDGSGQGNPSRLVQVSEQTATGQKIMSFFLTLLEDAYGYSKIQVTVTDGANATASALVYINVTSVNDDPVVGNDPNSPKIAYVGIDFEYDPQVTDPDGDALTYTFEGITILEDSSGQTFGVTTLPDWLTLDETTGILSGMPTNSDMAAGTTTEITGLRIRVTDSVAAPNTGEIVIGGTAGFNIDIKKIPLAPVISDFAPAETMQEGKILYAPFTIKDPNGDLLTLSITSNAAVLFPNDQAHLAITGNSLLNYDSGTNTYTFQTEPGVEYDLKLVIMAVEEGNNEKFNLANPVELTLLATDPDTKEAKELFFMTVEAVEDAPTVTGIEEGVTLTMAQGEEVRFSTYDIDPPNNTFINLMIGDADRDTVTATVEILSESETLFDTLIITNLGSSSSMQDPDIEYEHHQVFLPYLDKNGVNQDERPLDLIIIPAQHEYGNAIVRIKADDGKSTPAYSAPFNIVVTDTNDLPEITSVTAPDPIDEEGTLTIPFTVADWDVGDTLTIDVYEAENDGTEKLADNLISGIVLKMDGDELTLPATITIDETNVAQDIALEIQAQAALDQFGSTKIKIEIEDAAMEDVNPADGADDGPDDTAMVGVTINAVNDLPTITFTDDAGNPIEIAEVVIDEGADPGDPDPNVANPPFPLTVAIDDVEQTSVWVWVKSSNEALVSPNDFRLLVTGEPARELQSQPSLSKTQYTDPAKKLQIDLTQLADPYLSGKATIDLIVSNDPNVEQTLLTFDIVVESQPNPPEFTEIVDDIILWEDDTPPEGETSINPVTVKIRDIDGGTLTLSIKSSDPAIIPDYVDQPIIPNDVQHLKIAVDGIIVKKAITYPDSARYTINAEAGVEIPLELTVTPADDAYTETGSPVTITLELVDGTGEAATPLTFDVTIKPVNDPPEIRELVSIMPIEMNTSTTNQFKVYDADPNFNNMQVYAIKPAGENSILGNVSVTEDSRTDTEITYNLTINSKGSGTEEIVVTVVDNSDGQSQKIEQTVEVVVKPNAVLTPEIVTSISEYYIDEGTIDTFNIDVNYGGDPDDLSFKVEKETLEIVGDLNISVGPRTSPDDAIVHTYPLTIAHSGDGPYTDQNVTISVTLIVQGTDPVYADSETFDLTVIQINDLPSFTNLPTCDNAASKTVETFENIPLEDFSFKLRDPEGEVLYLDAEVISDPYNVIKKPVVFNNTSNGKITPSAPNIPVEVFMTITPEENIVVPDGVGEAIIQITVWDDINRDADKAVIACFTVKVYDSECPLITMDTEVLTNRSEPVTVPITIQDDHGGSLTVTAAWKSGSIANTSFDISGTDSNDEVELTQDGDVFVASVTLEITPGETSGTADIQINALDESGKNCPKAITLKVRNCLEGDIDCNGTIALADAIKGLQVLSGMDGIEVNLGADLDGDDQISLAEIIYVLRYIAGVANP